jgi:CrcB protein
LLRWWLGGFFRPPLGTLAVNLLGCLAMGLLAGWLARSGGNEQARLLLGAGLLGGFTTMSAFGLDSVDLWTRSPLAALAYVGATIAGSLGAVALGMAISR